MRSPIICAAFALGLIAGCSHAKSEAPASQATSEATLFEISQEQLSRLQFIKIAHKAIARPLISPAVVGFDDLKTSEVTPLVSGKVSKVLVREGDTVKLGQPLLAIASADSSDNAANLSRDRSILQAKMAILVRDTDLYAHKALSLEELESAQLDVTSAKVTVANDQAHMRITGSDAGDAVLRSPIAGVVVARHVSVGDAVQAAATPAFTITDPTAVWVLSQLYQEDLRRIALGDLAQIRSTVLDAPIEGKVIYIGASIDPDSLTIPVRIAAQNPARLKKGMYVEAVIVPAKSENAVTVPAASVLRDSDNLPFVYVQAAPGKLARRHVELGDQVGDEYVIEKGLEDSEMVLSGGAVFVQFADTLER